MPKPCSAVACPALLKRLAGAAIFLLLTSAWGWAQESVSGTSAASVDEAFLTFHQALSAAANDLLASAQRPPEMVRPQLDASPGSDPGFVSAPHAEGKTGQKIQLQKAVERVRRANNSPILQRSTWALANHA